MKKGFFCTIVLLIISCSSQSIKKNDFTGGSWHLYNMDGVICNECPEMEFDEGGRGKMINSPAKYIGFDYSILTNGNVKIVFDEKVFFDETEFSYQIGIEDNLEILELKSVNKKRVYILSREIKRTEGE